MEGINPLRKLLWNHIEFLKKKKEDLIPFNVDCEELNE